MSDNNKFRVDTIIFDDGFIHQDLSLITDEEEKKIMTWIANTRDEQFRVMMIKLGWTPPPEKKDGNV